MTARPFVPPPRRGPLVLRLKDRIEPSWTFSARYPGIDIGLPDVSDPETICGESVDDEEQP